MQIMIKQSTKIINCTMITTSVNVNKNILSLFFF